MTKFNINIKKSPLLIIFIISILSITSYLIGPKQSISQEFDGENAYKYVLDQSKVGPRIIGSIAHAETVNWLQDMLNNNGWDVTVQNGDRLGVKIQNVIAKRGVGDKWIILGAHYDSRSIADMDLDPSKRLDPVPGANDGASGVAILLELSRVLSNRLNKEVWLVFFDAEDNGNIQGQDWILGSREFVDKLDKKPDAAVIVDMVGDMNLNIYMEKNSDPVLTKQIWDIANDLGYSEKFISEYKHKIIDDHIPFLRAGIPAVDIIDFDYPYYHTTDDTADKVSPESLAIVGDTLLHWLEEYGSK